MTMFFRLTFVSLCAGLLASAAHADGLRDPMRPMGTPPAAPRALSIETLKLEGVIGKDKRVAIINGRLVRAGETIAGVKVLEVFANGIRIERAGKVSTLTLPEAPASSTVRVARSQDKKP
jgi:hypothetical protein